MWILATSKTPYSNINKIIRKYLQQGRWGSSADNLFRPQFYFLNFFPYIKSTSFQDTSDGVLFIFFLDCKMSNKNFFVSFLFHKIRRRVLIIPEVPLIFSPVFQNTEVAFQRCSTKIIVQQNDVMKHNSPALVVKSMKPLHENLLNTELHHTYFSKNLTTSSERCY